MSTPKKHKLLTLIVALLLCLATLSACANPNEAKYREALDMIEADNYAEALALFTELGDYKDAKKEVARFRYLPAERVDNYEDSDGKGTATTVFSFNEHNLPVKSVETDADGYQRTCLFAYNEDGKLTLFSDSDTDGISTKTEYVFNEDGTLAKEIYTDEEGVVSSLESTYNDKGEITLLESINKPEYFPSYEYTYDEQGKEILCIMRGEDMTYTVESFYNEKGDIVKSVFSDESGNVNMTEEYEYDEKGRKIKHTIKQADNKIDVVHEYTYNEKDQLISESYTASFDYTYTDNYTYDENGNAVKIDSTMTASDGTRTETSEIKYKLVYIPFDYSEEEWAEIYDVLLYW